jgi:formylglycine-generating enzyme required for sulfatase activity
VETSQNGWRSPGFEQTPTDPAVCVNWNDAEGICAVAQ